MGSKKRKRGGQPGNQNARKHGFYAANLSSEETAEFYQILNQGGTDPALAFIRTKYSYIVRNAPTNRRLLREVSCFLNKWLRTQGDHNRREKALFRKVVREINNSILNGNYILPEPIEAES